jgi:hypothetical protein
VADLVLTDAALESLKSSLSAALKDLEAVQHSLNKADASVLGADSVIDAESIYATVRAANLSATGMGMRDLEVQVDMVGQEMTEADLRLGTNAHHIVAE